MDARTLILNTLARKQGPVPWVEITVDEPVIAKILGKLPLGWMPNRESDIQLGLSWDDRVRFARQVGLGALGIYHWESLGSYQIRERQVISRKALIKGRADLRQMRVPKLTATNLCPEVERALTAIGDSGIALFVEFPFCFDPAIGDLGFDNFCFQALDDPEFLSEVFARYEEHTGNLIDIYSAMPEIDFIWIGDDLAYHSGPILSPSLLREHVFPVFRRLAARIRKPWIYHSDGDLSLVLEDILALGCAAIHPIEPACNDIYHLKETIGDRTCLHGGLSVDLIARGTVEQVTAETWRLLTEIGRGGGYLFSSANSVPFYANIDNVLAMAETVRQFNAMERG
jgi:hypothetical protein